MAGPRTVTIGGGTGSFTVLQSLKYYTDALSAIISSADNGGSTGRLLRDNNGRLPTGDVRQAAVALMEDDELSAEMRGLLTHRFTKGELAGHTLGNLMFAAIQEYLNGDSAAATDFFGRMLRTRGRIISVTPNSTNLHLRLPDGTIIYGEAEIGENCAGMDWFKKGIRPDLYLAPPAVLSEGAHDALQGAELIVLCPGKTYSSVAPNLLVDGMVKAIQEARHRPNPAKVVLISNLMTQPGQTDGFQVHDFVTALEALTNEEFIDTVVYNTAQPSPELLAKYAEEGEQPVIFDEALMEGEHYNAFGTPLLSQDIYEPQAGDAIKRTFIRHDSDLIARALMRIYYS